MKTRCRSPTAYRPMTSRSRRGCSPTGAASTPARPAPTPRYESFQLEGDHRLQNGLEFHSTFTYADAWADNQGPANVGFGGESGGSRATSILNRKADWGHVYGTRRLRWNTTGLFDLPVGRGRMVGANMSRLGRRSGRRMAALCHSHHADRRLHHSLLPLRTGRSFRNRFGPDDDGGGMGSQPSQPICRSRRRHQHETTRSRGG